MRGDEGKTEAVQITRVLFLLASFLEIPTILEFTTGYRVVDKHYKKFTDFITLVSVCLFARDFTLYISGRTQGSLHLCLKYTIYFLT